MTVHLLDSSHAPTGMAVIVCPGGGFHYLSIMQGGVWGCKMVDMAIADGRQALAYERTHAAD